MTAVPADPVKPQMYSMTVKLRHPELKGHSDLDEHHKELYTPTDESPQTVQLERHKIIIR